jgi:hypothetical protein
MPGPDNTLPGASSAAAAAAEGAPAAPGVNESVVPEMVTPESGTLGTTDREVEEGMVALWLMLTTPVPVLAS